MEVVVKHVVQHVHWVNIITVLFVFLTHTLLDALLAPLVHVQMVTLNLLLAVLMLTEPALLVQLLVLKELINQLHAVPSQISNV
jgi:hypothetical protein